MKPALAASLLLLACRSAAPLPSPSAPPRAPPPWPPTVAGMTDEQLGQGTALVRNSCGACHSQEMLQQQRLTRPQWEATVKKMRRFGAAVSDEDEALMVETLSKAFGPEAPAYQAALVENPEDAVMPVPDGPFASSDLKGGETLYGHHCAPCHGEDARGKVITDEGQNFGLGINLVDKPGLYRAPQFARTVREGRGRMPAFEHLTDTEVGQVLAFLRTK